MLPYNLIGRSIYINGDYIQAGNMLSRGIALAEKFNDQELLAGSLAFYGAGLWNQGKREEGTKVAQRAIDLAEELGHPSRIAGNNMVLGISQALCGFFDEAIVYFTRCLELSAGTEDLPTRYIPHGGLGYVYWQMGDVARAKHHIDECLTLAEKGGSQALIQLPLFQCVRAEILAHEQQWETAVSLAEAALELAKKTRQEFSQALVQQHLSRILLTAFQPDWARAEQLLQAAIAFFKQGNGRLSTAIATLDLIKLYQTQGRQQQAQALLPAVRETFQVAGVQWYLAEIEKL